MPLLGRRERREVECYLSKGRRLFDTKSAIQGNRPYLLARVEPLWHSSQTNLPAIVAAGLVIEAKLPLAMPSQYQYFGLGGSKRELQRGLISRRVVPFHRPFGVVEFRPCRARRRLITQNTFGSPSGPNDCNRIHVTLPPIVVPSIA